MVISMDGEEAAGQEAAAAAAAADQRAGSGGATAEGALREAGPETCGCWLGQNGARFATGHQKGLVLIWQIPQAVHGEPAACGRKFSTDGRSFYVRLRACLALQRHVWHACCWISRVQTDRGADRGVLLWLGCCFSSGRCAVFDLFGWCTSCQVQSAVLLCCLSAR